MPPLPDKSMMNMVSEDDSEFVERRKRDLRRFMKRLGKHRVLGQSTEYIEFIKNEKFYHL